MRSCPPRSLRNADFAQLRTSGELRKLLVSVEVTLARDRLRGSWRPAQFRAGRVDGHAAAASQHATTLAQNADRVFEEEEDNRHRNGAERAVGERQTLSFRQYDVGARRPFACERDHLFAVVQPRDARAGYERVV